MASSRRVKTGWGVVRCRPSVSGSWSCGLVGGVSVPRGAKSAISALRSKLGASTRFTATA